MSKKELNRWMSTQEERMDSCSEFERRGFEPGRVYPEIPWGLSWSWETGPWTAFLLKGLVKRVLLWEWKWSGEGDAENKRKLISQN